MWFALVKAKSGKRYITFGAFNTEGEALQKGMMACTQCGGQEYFTVEIPNDTPQYKLKSKVNYAMFEKYHIQLDDIALRHYKG